MQVLSEPKGQKVGHKIYRFKFFSFPGNVQSQSWQSQGTFSIISVLFSACQVLLCSAYGVWSLWLWNEMEVCYGLPDWWTCDHIVIIQGKSVGRGEMGRKKPLSLWNCIIKNSFKKRRKYAIIKTREIKEIRREESGRTTRGMYCAIREICRGWDALSQSDWVRCSALL